MTEDHLASLLSLAEAAKKDKEGFQALPDGRHMTLYAAFNGASLTVSRVSAIKRDGELVQARTVKGEVYLLAVADLFAGAVESATVSARKAGFV
ncbi:MAG: hypothetical protein KC776_07225 [Myxococcales bacterium]|nr:hypothetical protein [Myxococcales bacterium]MCB9580484.1 hypothetical protein [Polyangiaceae bacterium]